MSKDPSLHLHIYDSLWTDGCRHFPGLAGDSLELLRAGGAAADVDHRPVAEPRESHRKTDVQQREPGGSVYLSGTRHMDGRGEF